MKLHGYPMRMAEIIAGLPGASYVVRRSVYDARTIRQAKKAVVTAFKTQLAGPGAEHGRVPVNCPTNWHMSPPDRLGLDSRRHGAVLSAGRFQGDG